MPTNVSESWERDKELLRVVRYLTPTTCCCDDVVLWLCPDLRCDSPAKRNALIRWLRRQDYVDRPLTAAMAKALFRRIDEVAAQNNLRASCPPMGKIFLESTLGPLFCRNPEKCIAVLCDVRDSCSNAAVVDLVEALTTYYETILEFEIPGFGKIADRDDKMK